jgi:hypothetical protein
MRKTGLKELRTCKSPTGLYSLKVKTVDFQLLETDPERQNIIGQNKGWQR